MNTRLGNILYRAGLVGAGIIIVYTIDVIWVHESGSSLLPISGRFVSREEMLAIAAIGIAMTILLWGSGTVARYLVNKSAESRAAANRPRVARVPGQLRQPTAKPHRPGPK